VQRGDRTQFQRWLIERLKETRYAVFSGETLDELAERLGVQPAVLRTAQAEKAAELAQLGRQIPQRVRMPTSAPSPLLTVRCPKEVYDEITERARRMEIGAGELVRAIVHTLLSGPDNPWWLLAGWMYEGKRITMGQSRWKIQVRLSHGAVGALRTRADRLGTTATALARGAVIDYLEGRMAGVHFVALTEMWQDPNKYWTGELIRKGRYDGHPGVTETRNARKS